eukprot:COSAG06_NODE_40777_length_398_cov_1.896321_1_plen_53_part_10
MRSNDLKLGGKPGKNISFAHEGERRGRAGMARLARRRFSWGALGFFVDVPATL